MTTDYLQHYYKDDQKELNNRKEISFRFLSINYTFVTADNIFSKDKVDTGSSLLLETALKAGIKDRVLDYGCGYGVVGIVLSKEGYDSFGLDVVDRALDLSMINNDLNKTNFKVAKVSDDLSKYNNEFNTVLLNPPIRAGKEVIYSMFKNAYNFLKPEGTLYIVIRKQHGALSAIKELETYFDQVSVIKKSKGFFIIESVKN